MTIASKVRLPPITAICSGGSNFFRNIWLRKIAGGVQCQIDGEAETAGTDMNRISQLALPLILAAMLVCGANAAHAARGHGDWPCIQREVPNISAGMVWSGDPIDAEDQSWASEAKVSARVADVASRRKTVEEALAAIDQFAAELKEDRPRLLTALFTGVLQRLNGERRQIMAGIKRYARRQAALAERIREASLQRETLRQKEPRSEEEQRKLAELQDQIAWDTRIYEEREQSLTYVCETPVLLERRLFQIGKHISQLTAAAKPQGAGAAGSTGSSAAPPASSQPSAPSGNQ